MNKDQLVEEFLNNIVREDLNDEDNYKLILEHIEGLNVLCDVLCESWGGGLRKGKGVVGGAVVEAVGGGGAVVGGAAGAAVAGGNDDDDDDKIKYKIPKRKYYSSEIEEFENAVANRRKLFITKRTNKLSRIRGRRQGRQGGTK